ncbi:MAG TPA: translation initiation factor IF-2 [Candidatus Paceibacterota bacterium]|nr:translation initiation factor IF-2 [Verrucomicrobiota bacterium]HSA11150.1 translation initiation factor IF-2 [Candidatus Paceibacterota bacterium]
MPVRIYDISKKLHLESKQVLAKAKALGLTAARVASSSLDKITAEYLELELLKDHPELAAPPPPPPPAPLEPPVVELVAPPAPEVKTEQTVEASATDAAASPVAELAAVQPEPAISDSGIVVLEAPAVPEPAPPVVEPPPPPPPPPGPKVGDKVGFIQLRPRPGTTKVVTRPADQKKPDFIRRGDVRGVRGAPTAPQLAVPRAAAAQKGGAKTKAGDLTVNEPKIVLPADAQVITLKPPIVVRDLAEQIKQKPFKIIADLMETGVFANVNQAIDEKVAQRICAKYGFKFEVEKRERGSGQVHAPVRGKPDLDVEDKVEDLVPRAPVVTIMGHVDHGKTTLLDVIRKSNVAAGEAGGITQHIGAYTISFPHPERKKEPAQITFLDTPGHAAFSSMRARGANVTDLVVLVVAANDGVMPQTIEALNHARAARVPVLVAVNKIDHPNANPLKVRQQLQDKGVVPDDWGGDTIFVDVSALTKNGLDKLIEMILLQADLLELKANPNRRAKGNVIESGLEPGGPTATVLVRKGTLRVSDVIICGQYYGRVRALISEEGKRTKEAGPSVAVKVLGLNGVPDAGLEFSVVEDEKAARDLAEQRGQAAKALGQEATRAKMTLENLFDQLASNAGKVLKLVVKADTQGSVEAIVDALKKIESEKVSLEVIHSAVGTITESDVALASASEAVILGFHTRIDSGVADKAKHEGVQIKLYAVIYELIDQVKEGMAGLLEPLLKDITAGAAEVRKIFRLSKGAPVAGCMVTSGRIVKGKVRVRRRKEVIYEGIAQSLRRFQDEVNEVRAGMECGIRIDGFSEFQVGDSIECYTMEKIAQKL